MALPSGPTFKKRLSPPAQLAGSQPLRNSKVPHILKIRRFAGVFDGSFSVSRILRLFERLFDASFSVSRFLRLFEGLFDGSFSVSQILRLFERLFDGSFSVSRILRLFERLFCEKIEKKRPQEARCRYKMVKNSRK